MPFSMNLFCHLLKILEKISCLQFIFGWVLLGKWADAPCVPRNECYAKNNKKEWEDYTKITQLALLDPCTTKQSHLGNTLCETTSLEGLWQLTCHIWISDFCAFILMLAEGCMWLVSDKSGAYVLEQHGMASDVTAYTVSLIFNKG